MSNQEPSTATEPENDAASLVGKSIAGRYKVERLLGEGGMGAVYLVFHTGIRKRMALKVLRADLMTNPAVVARFEREAMAAAHFDHPNVAAAHDYGRIDEGSFYLVLEYVEGQELRAAIERADGPLPLARALFIGRQLASALVRASELGIVHRDLKPENIMLVKRDGHGDFVKVLDFGLAQVSRRIADRPAEEQGGAQPTALSARITKVGDIFGTPAYMAPEQSVGESTDTRTDLYALGIILYELITGQRPFKGKSLLVLVQQHLSAPPPPMSEVAPSLTVPRAVEELVQRLLAKSPEDRIQHPQELLDAIDQIIAAHDLAWSPGSPSHARGAGVSTSGSGAALPAAAATYLPSLKRALTTLRNRAADTFAAKKDKSLLVRLRSRAVDMFAKKDKSMSARLRGRVAALLTRKKNRGLLVWLRRPLPPPMPRMPAGLAVASVALVIALLLGVAFKREQAQAPKTRPRPAALSASGVARLPRPESAGSQSAVDTVAAQDPDGSAAQARQVADDPRSQRTQVRSHISQHRPVEAMRAIAKLAELDPDAGRDPEIAQAIVAALQSNEEAAQAATRLLEKELGEAGVELLYDLTLKQTGARWKLGLNQSLAKPEVLARATPALRVALELRAAKRCEAKRDLLPRAQSEGDGRALSQLKSLVPAKGCGILGSKDCWPCLRKSPALAEAIAALEARTQPPGASSVKP